MNYGHGIALFYVKSNGALIKIPTKTQKKEVRWHAFDAPGIRKTMEYELFGRRPPTGRHWMYEESRAREMILNCTLRPNKTGRPEYILDASELTMLDTNWTDIQEGDSNYLPNGEKNVNFIKRLISMYPTTSPIIVDYFAGSGTTLHATIEANAVDDGKRTCFLITNNENNICNKICYPRVSSVIKNNNLKYYRTDFVPAEPTDENKVLLTHRSVEMLCLRESTFDLVSDDVEWKVYKNQIRHTIIVFNQRLIPTIKNEIAGIEGAVSIYIFSLGDDDFSRQFEEFDGRVKVCSIPEAILRVYRRIFKK